MIKIVSWNIRQGGGSRLQQITRALDQLAAQLVVLSEYRNNNSGYKLRQMALRMGYKHQMVSGANSNDNSVIILSKFPANFELFPKSDPIYFHNIIKAEFDAFNLYGLYLPHKKKHRLFDLIHERIQNDEKPMIFCGDFNSGINYVDQTGNSFWYEDELFEMKNLGCVDAFRHFHSSVKEYSWYSHQGNGYRYDHTFVHNDLLPVISTCHYEHEHRVNGISDHSPMILEIGS